MRCRLLALGVLLLPLGGCCSLARFFCGPDKTPWVSIDYGSPEAACATLLEALRRDDPEIVYRSLSLRYQRSLGIDKLSAELAWPKIREQNPGLHVAGYAKVPPAQRFGADRARIDLDVEGHPVRVELVRQALWELVYRRPNGSEGLGGAVLADWSKLARIEDLKDPDDPQQFAERSQIWIAPLEFGHDNLDRVPLEAIEHVALTHRWKVDHLQMLDGA